MASPQALQGLLRPLAHHPQRDQTRKFLALFEYEVSEHGDFISDRSVQVYALAVDGAPMTFNPELWKAARKLAFEELAHNRRENARMSRERDERRQLDVLKKKYGE